MPPWARGLASIATLLLLALPLQAGEKEGRCGWRWCLQQLAAVPTAAESAAAASAADDREGEGGGSGREWNPSKLLRHVLQQVDVHK